MVTTVGGVRTRAMWLSRVLRKLREGENASCFKSNLDSARVIEIAALSGFDCVWVDTEHVASDWSLIERQIWAAKAHDTDVIVRVARGSYSDLVHPLELDAAGIMVPHVMNLEDAREVVRRTRFHPIGLRPLDGGNADGDYGALPLVPYMEQGNSQRFIALQIEDPEPPADLDAIAALKGVDMLFFGPGDFSQAIGAPGDWNHPQLLAAREAVAAACRRHGKFAGTVGSPVNHHQWKAMGYQFISMGADVIGLDAHCTALVDAFHTPPLTAQPAAPNGKAGLSAYA